MVEPLLWDWGAIGNAALGAGFGAATVTLYRDHRQTKSQASHLAVRLAVVLEAYASSCQQFIEANENADHEPDQEFPNWRTRLPELPPYPEDVEGWRALDLKLGERCLNLRNKIAGSQSIIGATIDVAMDALGDMLDEHAASRGIEAWEIAVALRSRYGLGKSEMVWDYVEALTASKEAAIKSQDERAKAQAKFMNREKKH